MPCGARELVRSTKRVLENEERDKRYGVPEGMPETEIVDGLVQEQIVRVRYVDYSLSPAFGLASRPRPVVQTGFKWNELDDWMLRQR